MKSGRKASREVPWNNLSRISGKKRERERKNAKRRRGNHCLILPNKQRRSYEWSSRWCFCNRLQWVILLIIIRIKISLCRMRGCCSSGSHLNERGKQSDKLMPVPKHLRPNLSVHMFVWERVSETDETKPKQNHEILDIWCT